MQEVTSAAPGFLCPCVHALVRSFLPEEESEERRSSQGHVKTAAEAAAAPPIAMPEPWLLPRVHKALHGILVACPLGTRCAQLPGTRCPHHSSLSRRDVQERKLLGLSRGEGGAGDHRIVGSLALRRPRASPRSQLFACLKEHFPHRRRDLQCHCMYLKHTLHAASYANAVLPRLVQLSLSMSTSTSETVASGLVDGPAGSSTTISCTCLSRGSSSSTSS